MTICILLLILCLLLQIMIISAQQMTPDGCFQQWSDTSVACSRAYDQRSGLNDQQCRVLCNMNRGCRAVHYSGSSRACHLYGTSTTRRVRRDLGGHRLQKRYSGCPGGGTGGVGFRPPPPVGLRPAAGRGRRKRNYGNQLCDACQPGLQRAAGSTYYRATGHCCRVRPTAPPTLPPGASCPPGQLTRYFEIEGYQLSGNPDYTFTASSEQACINACTNNRLPDGRTAPCRSFDFDSPSKKCSISFQQSGVAQTNPNPDVKHYEKTCVDSNFGQRCPGPYFRGPQKILVGYAQTVTNAASESECLQICVNSQARFGFTCLSGMFYFQETTENCILNTETRSTHPDLYIQENQDKVDYFEPGCTPTRVSRQTQLHKQRNRNVIRIDSPEYGGWTMCDSLRRRHKRFRACSTFNPNNCEMNEVSCDAANEQQYDIPETTTTSQVLTTGITAKTDAILGTTTSPSALATSTQDRPLTTDTDVDHSRNASRTSKEAMMVRKSTDTEICQPLIKPDGSKDCENGMRRKADGKMEKCHPDKAKC